MTKLPKIKTREAAEAAMDKLALATHRRDKLEAEMNVELTRVRARYESDLAVLAEAIKIETARLRDWADSDPALLGKSRSIKLLHGTVGYRLGNWALKLKSGFTAARAIALCKQVIGPGYVRVKEELDKEAIIADRAHYTSESLAACGISIEQGERFFVEPEKTEAPA